MTSPPLSSQTQLPIVSAPASMIQRQFWLIHQLQPDNSAYNIASVFDIEGPLDITALNQAANEVVARHETFRTIFTTRGRELVQKILPELHIDLPLVDMQTQQNMARTTQLINQEICHPFNLEKGPLVRLLLIKQNDARYILLICIHHIITDLQSKQMFAAELSLRYNLLTEGSAPSSSFNKPPRPYRDYAVWQQSWLSSDQALAMGQFWQQELKGQSSTLNLPLDQPRPARLSYHGSHQPFRLSTSLSDALKEFSKKNALDIFVTLLAAYLVVLARYSNQHKITTGVPLTNRRQQEHKDIMGCFVNILPLNFDLSSSPNFAEVAGQVRMKMLLAHRNQEIPFEKIVQLIKPQRDPSYNPIFQAGFTVEPLMVLDLHHIKVTPRKVHNQGAQLDLFLNIWSLNGQIEGYFEYNSALFRQETIQRFSNHYENILAAILHDANLPINRLPLLGKDELAQLQDWNNTSTDFPRQLTLIALFEQQVEIRPDAIAATFAEQQLSYGQLNERANQLAHQLDTLGVGPGSLVGIYLDRSLEMLIAIIAILKSGGAYVPLDPTFPVHRIGQMLEDSKVKVILTQENLAQGLPVNQARLLFLDRDWPQIASNKKNNLDVAISPDDLAYVIFTSGSTGRPKGVQVPQGAVVNFLLSMQNEPGISAEDTLLAVTTLSFDISVLELLLPLSVGAKVVIASRTTATDGNKLLALLRSSNATIIQGTPTTYHLLLTAGWKSPLPVKVLCGGEVLPHDLAQKLIQLLTNVWNLYGPTETTIWSSCYRIMPDQPVLIGKPIANTRMYIVNDQLQLCPIGVAGELLIGGLGVSRGYMNQPKLTAKQFIPDTFSGPTDKLVYRTGDLACYLPDGNIKLLGRLDHQVKIRGYRIELGDIETALNNHPAVKQVAVISHDFGARDERLVAYLTLKQDETITTEELRRYLRELLPDYMTPALFTVLPKMPLTLNNKINRRALPAPAQTRPVLNRGYHAPQNESEQRIARLWGEVLQLNQVGIDDNFFDLGGDSLLSVQLTAMVSEELGCEIPIAKFYQYPTVRTFAAFLHKSAGSVHKNATSRAQKQRQALSRKQLSRRRTS